jgi:hypothetical protein
MMSDELQWAVTPCSSFRREMRERNEGQTAANENVEAAGIEATLFFDHLITALPPKTCNNINCRKSESVTGSVTGFLAHKQQGNDSKGGALPLLWSPFAVPFCLI